MHVLWLPAMHMLWLWLAVAGYYNALLRTTAHYNALQRTTTHVLWLAAFKFAWPGHWCDGL